MSEPNNKYEDMDQEDLEATLNNISEILKQRKQKILIAIKDRNLDQLKDALKDNKKKKLSEDIWDNISFSNMDEKDIDYFLYIRGLPGYHSHDGDRRRRTHGNFTMTEEAVNEGLFNKELFDFFINHQELSEPFKAIIESESLSDNISTEIIHKMFQLELIYPSPELLDDIINSQYDNYIQYVLNHNIFDIQPSHYEKVYCNTWSIGNNSTLALVKEKYPEYKNIPLEMLISTFMTDTVMYTKEEEKQAYREFTYIEYDLFFEILEKHPFTIEDLKQILTNDNFGTKKFTNIMEVVINKYPDYLEKIQDISLSNELKPIFDYYSLKNNLKVKGTDPKKIKM